MRQEGNKPREKKLRSHDEKILKNKYIKLGKYMNLCLGWSSITQCVHSTVPDLLSGRCDSDESRETMRSETKERGHMQD